MEYCSEGGVIDLMNKRLRDRLRETEVLKIFSDVCEGLAVMHHLDPPLLHRDLKIENILVCPPPAHDPLAGPTYKLADFGSTVPLLRRSPAKSLEEIKRVENDLNRATTLQYRAPEMVDLTQRRVIDEKADIWALGVLLYKLCYYITPFEENGGGAPAILQARFRFPASPAYSPQLKNLVSSMLQQRSEDRPTIDQLIVRTYELRKLTPPSLAQKYVQLTKEGKQLPPLSAMSNQSSLDKVHVTTRVPLENGTASIARSTRLDQMRSISGSGQDRDVICRPESARAPHRLPHRDSGALSGTDTIRSEIYRTQLPSLVRNTETHKASSSPNDEPNGLRGSLTRSHSVATTSSNPTSPIPATNSPSPRATASSTSSALIDPSFFDAASTRFPSLQDLDNNINPSAVTSRGTISAKTKLYEQFSTQSERDRSPSRSKLVGGAGQTQPHKPSQLSEAFNPRDWLTGLDDGLTESSASSPPPPNLKPNLPFSSRAARTKISPSATEVPAADPDSSSDDDMEGPEPAEGIPYAREGKRMSTRPGKVSYPSWVREQQQGVKYAHNHGNEPDTNLRGQSRPSFERGRQPGSGSGTDHNPHLVSKLGARHEYNSQPPSIAALLEQQTSETNSSGAALPSRKPETFNGGDTPAAYKRRHLRDYPEDFPGDIRGGNLGEHADSDLGEIRREYNLDLEMQPEDAMDLALIEGKSPDEALREGKSVEQARAHATAHALTGSPPAASIQAQVRTQDSSLKHESAVNENQDTGKRTPLGFAGSKGGHGLDHKGHQAQDNQGLKHTHMSSLVHGDIGHGDHSAISAPPWDAPADQSVDKINQVAPPLIPSPDPGHRPSPKTSPRHDGNGAQDLSDTTSNSPQTLAASTPGTLKENSEVGKNRLSRLIQAANERDTARLRPAPVVSRASTGTRLNAGPSARAGRPTGKDALAMSSNPLTFPSEAPPVEKLEESRGSLSTVVQQHTTPLPVVQGGTPLSAGASGVKANLPSAHTHISQPVDRSSDFNLGKNDEVAVLATAPPLSERTRELQKAAERGSGKVSKAEGSGSAGAKEAKPHGRADALNDRGGDQPPKAVRKTPPTKPTAPKPIPALKPWEREAAAAEAIQLAGVVRSNMSLLDGPTPASVEPSSCKDEHTSELSQDKFKGVNNLISRWQQQAEQR